MKRYLAALTLLLLVILAVGARAPASGSSAATSLDRSAYLPFVARELLPTATPTITPTPTPPFQGAVQILHSESAVDGWGWPVGAEVRVVVSEPGGTQRETLTLTAQADGRLPWTSLSSSVEEGDWITMTLGSLQAGFPVVLLAARGDPQNDTVEGDARPLARVHALVGHGQEWHWLETNADEMGHFLLDFSSLVDWDYQDYIRVGQFLNANGMVTVSGHSPHFYILPPPTATATQTPTPTATPSHDAPPFIHIAAPAEAHVGDEIILDASGTWDIDADPFELTWTQYHNPDRYQGLEYVTGNDVLLQDLGGSQSAIYPDSLTGFAQVRFVPEWPGNYRFELLATDKDGQSDTAVDVLVKLAAPLDWDFRGASVGVPGHQLNETNLRQIDYAFGAMKDLGIEWFEIGTSWFQDGYEANEIFPIYDEEDLLPGGLSHQMQPTTTDERLSAVIELARHNGLKVFLRPGLEAIENDGWNWRGVVHPSDPDRWWASYLAFQRHYADLAQRTGVEMYSVGFELDSMIGETERWESIISDVRARYSGPIAYGCSGPFFDNQIDYDPSALDHWSPTRHGDFWRSLDIVGISWYTQLTGSTHATNAELRENVRQLIGNFVVPLYDLYGKPFFFGEFDFSSEDGGARDAIRYRGQSGVVDMDEQARAFEVVISQFSRLPFFKGMFPSGFYFFYHPSIQPNDSTNSIWNKPAMKVFELWYER